MSHNYPPHNQPGYGYPQQPAPKQGMGKGAKFALGCGGAVVAALILMGGCAALVASDGDDDSMRKTDSPQTSQSTSSKKPKDKPTDTGNVKPPASEAEQFKGCVNKNGSAAEKGAVSHVTKVTGTDDRNDIFDAPEVFTDFTGGFMSTDQGKAKLIASAFASCYESENGLVTVYGSDGEIIANGNF